MNKKENNKSFKTKLEFRHKDLQEVYSYYVLIINQDLRLPIRD
jgi:hypothetical protein